MVSSKQSLLMYAHAEARILQLFQRLMFKLPTSKCPLEDPNRLSSSDCSFIEQRGTTL